MAQQFNAYSNYELVQIQTQASQSFIRPNRSTSEYKQKVQYCNIKQKLELDNKIWDCKWVIRQLQIKNYRLDSQNLYLENLINFQKQQLIKIFDQRSNMYMNQNKQLISKCRQLQKLKQQLSLKNTSLELKNISLQQNNMNLQHKNQQLLQKNMKLQQENRLFQYQNKFYKQKQTKMAQRSQNQRQMNNEQLNILKRQNQLLRNELCKMKLDSEYNKRSQNSQSTVQGQDVRQIETNNEVRGLSAAKETKSEFVQSKQQHLMRQSEQENQQNRGFIQKPVPITYI